MNENADSVKVIIVEFIKCMIFVVIVPVFTHTLISKIIFNINNTISFSVYPIDKYLKMEQAEFSIMIILYL